MLRIENLSPRSLSFAAHALALADVFEANAGATVAPSLAVGPTHGVTVTTAAYYGGCNLWDGRAFLAPADALAPAVFDPDGDTLTHLSAHGVAGGESFGGAVQIDDDTVVMIPYEATHMGRVSLSSGAYSQGAYVATYPQYRTGILTTKGDRRVIVMATVGAGNVGYYYPDSDTFEAGPALTGSYSARLLPDGRILFIRSGSAACQILDVETGVLTAGANLGGGRGATLLTDGRFVQCPATSGNIFSATFAGALATTSPALAAVTNKFVGCAFAPNGDVIFAPFDYQSVLGWRPSTNALIAGAAVTADDYYNGALSLRDGRVLFIPHKAAAVGLYTHCTGLSTTMPSSAIASAYYNQAA
ncbi:MAG: hypothetical protein ACK4OJ_05080 [Brevundimonas sp.]